MTEEQNSAILEICSRFPGCKAKVFDVDELGNERFKEALKLLAAEGGWTMEGIIDSHISVWIKCSPAQDEPQKLDNKTLRELMPLFKTGQYVPYLTADVTLTVHLSIFHAEATDESGELTGEALETCTASLDLPTNNTEDETGAYFDLSDFLVHAPSDGWETRTPPFDLEEVVKALHLDIDAPIWQLRFE